MESGRRFFQTLFYIRLKNVYKGVAGDKEWRPNERWPPEGKLITITKKEVTHYGRITSDALISKKVTQKGFDIIPVRPD